MATQPVQPAHLQEPSSSNPDSKVGQAELSRSHRGTGAAHKELGTEVTSGSCRGTESPKELVSRPNVGAGVSPGTEGSHELKQELSLPSEVSSGPC